MKRTPYGTTVFCDDIRDETSGKKTLVGVYTGEMIIAGDLPSTVPQFSFLVTYFEPPEMEDSPVQIRIYLPGSKDDEPLLDVEVPVERAKQASRAAAEASKDFVGVGMFFKVHPLLIENEGHLRVRAFRDGETYKIGSMAVRKAREDEVLGLPQESRGHKEFRGHGT